GRVSGTWDQKIAIIGAGPAGLSCAYYLAVMGYTPTVFEKHQKPGGMMTYGIPSFKLEKDVIDAEIDVLRQLGVEFKCGVEVGKDVTIADLKKQGYEAFYIAIGCQGGRLPGVPGENAQGTDIAVRFLEKALSDTSRDMSGEVIVVGGGNVAIDCARTAHRKGADKVSMYCLESRETMPASPEEIREAEEENVVINPGWGPREVLTDAQGKVTGIVFKKCLSTIDENGRFNPKYDESQTVTVPADRIVFAIGQAIEWGRLLEGTAVTFHHGSYPVADKFTYQTADPCIFVGGDVFTGPKFVIDAIGQGHEASESLARFVSRNNAPMTIGRDRRYFKSLDKENIAIDSYDAAQRQVPAVDPSIDAKNGFRDNRLTLTEEQVKAETARCLGCGASIVDPNKCIGCGLCTTRCEFDAIHLLRDHPECSDMRRAEDKVGGLLSYAVPRAFKILLNSGSEEAKMMRKKKREYDEATKEFHKTHPHTGNGVDIRELMDEK
ncbi:MAG: FAD-dependent oxidoreductase, partial [Oscillospiraceae bacterium]|nr:FAD-dependent oxidoreductase [Oscillospiraceae bacterium]